MLRFWLVNEMTDHEANAMVRIVTISASCQRWTAT